MTVRVEVTWEALLEADGRARMLLALAALPEVRRTVDSPDGRRTAVYAADLAAVRVEAALREAGLSPLAVTGSLAPEAEAALVAGHGERFRPIGR